ncbi:MAG: hypothetical protein JKY22_11975 [Flavobacteriaceae bacterium]|nr:hypothetical protein [Flavobacteriaceae bacterium]PCJ26464.1 MAG: hypothetical protein COA94_04985 [Rickettsiales bacterium]
MDNLHNDILESFEKNTTSRNVSYTRVIRCNKGLWKVSSHDYGFAEEKAIREFLKYYFTGVYDVDIDTDLIKFSNGWMQVSYGG